MFSIRTSKIKVMSAFTNECNNNTLNTDRDTTSTDQCAVTIDNNAAITTDNNAAITTDNNAVITIDQCATSTDQCAENTDQDDYHISMPVRPTPEEIGECSPGATFTTYKMGGSTGVSGKENQDACSVISLKKNGIKYAVTTVCDGHGIYGQHYSNMVVTLLPQSVTQRFDEVLTNPLVTLKEIFFIVTNKIKDQMEHKHGGTTATITILSDGRLIVANVGDCEALIKIDLASSDLIIERNGTIISNDSTNNVIRATVDHNISNTAEINRVLATGAEIKYASNKGFARQVDVFTKVEENGEVKLVQNPHSDQEGGFVSNMSKDPAVYFYGGITLNMTRSIGDWKGIYISSEPDVTCITWTPGKRARLLVASDGYFNCFSEEDQLNELSFDLKPTEICLRGHTAVGKTFGHRYADNTTIVVLDRGSE